MEKIKVPWACQGNVNGPSPSLVGVHTSFPELSEGAVMTVSTVNGLGAKVRRAHYPMCE